MKKQVFQPGPMLTITVIITGNFLSLKSGSHALVRLQPIPKHTLSLF